MLPERVDVAEVVELHPSGSVVRPEDYKLTALALPDDLCFDEWAALGETLRKAITSTAWWVGDWLVFAHEHFDDTQGRAAVYRRLADLGLEHETVERYRRVCALFPPTLRHESLSWTHHDEVASLELEEACDLLIAAHDNGWSCRKLRDAVRASKAIEATSTEVDEVHGISVRFKTAPPAVLAERLARGIEKTLRDLGLDGDVKVR